MISREVLAESTSYTIVREFEAALLLRRPDSSTLIGDFYGDPECAIIDTAERWCAVAGCGLVIYFLREPFRDYTPSPRRRTSRHHAQCIELGRESGGTWWITSLRQIGASDIEVTTESGATRTVSFAAHA